MGIETPLFLFGPCSAESREQVSQTAKDLCEMSNEMHALQFIFRAGVWKPRTSPYSFQGAGDQALEWLAEVKQRFGIPVATEVATSEHVKAALHSGIDYLWIGARSSANPIAVEAISRQIAVSSNLPKAVFIKNPVNADAQLWLGNIERLEKTGVPVIAVHRGCSHKPTWGMAHTVRTARPDIPILLDPSHMSGDAEQVPVLLQKVEELRLDGAMVEVHAHPEEALSDKKQQITPAQLGTALQPILSQLCSADRKCPLDGQVELNWLRAEIDELDAALWETIAARMDVSRRIGEWKKAHNVAPLQPARYQQVLEARKEWAKENGIDAAFIEQVFNAIHSESLKRQE